MTPVRLEPAASRSQAKHSTTEPLGSEKKQKQKKQQKNIYCRFAYSYSNTGLVQIRID